MLTRYHNYLLQAALDNQLLDFPSGGGQPKLASNMGVANGIFVSPRLIAKDQQKNDALRGVLRSFTFDGADLDAMERAETFVALLAQFNQELFQFGKDWKIADEFVSANAVHSQKSTLEEKQQDAFANATFNVTRKALGDSAKFMERIRDAIISINNTQNTPQWIKKLVTAIRNIDPGPLLVSVSGGLKTVYVEVSKAAKDLESKPPALRDILKQAVKEFFGPASGVGDTLLTAELTAMKLWYHPTVHKLNVELVNLWSVVPVHVCSYHTLWLALANQLSPRNAETLGTLKNFMTASSQTIPNLDDLAIPGPSGDLRLTSSASAPSTGSVAGAGSDFRWDAYKRMRNLVGVFDQAWNQTKTLVNTFEQSLGDLNNEERAVVTEVVAKWKHSPLRRLAAAWEDYIGNRMIVSGGDVPALLVAARKYPEKQPKDNNNHLRAGPTISMLRATLPDMAVEISVMLDVALQASIAVDDIYDFNKASRY